MSTPEQPEPGAHRRRAEGSIDLHDAGPMRALAHPLRLRILGLLRVEGPQSVGALVQATGAASGSVSYHLARSRSTDSSCPRPSSSATAVSAGGAPRTR